MGEGINIYREHASKRNQMLNDAFMARESEVMYSCHESKSFIEKKRQAAIDAISGHIGATKSFQGKRRSINVEINKESVRHIANSIANNRIPISIKDLDRLDEFIAGVGIPVQSKTDKSGRHTKHHSSYFMYYPFDYNGTTLYFNIKNQHYMDGRKAKTRWVLYDITSQLRSGGDDK